MVECVTLYFLVPEGITIKGALFPVSRALVLCAPTSFLFLSFRLRQRDEDYKSHPFSPKPLHISGFHLFGFSFSLSTQPNIQSPQLGILLSLTATLPSSLFFSSLPVFQLPQPPQSSPSFLNKHEDLHHLGRRHVLPGHCLC